MAQQRRRYAGTIPNIAEAYKNDPRTLLANSALATGISTAPVAGGGWGVTDGLARAAQAIAGSLMQKGQDKRYAQREDDYTKALQQAALAASNPQPNNINPNTVNPSGDMAQAAQALTPPQQPPAPAPAPAMAPPPVDPLAPLPEGVAPPPQMAAGGPNLPAGGQMPPMGAATPAAMRGTPPPRPTRAVASRGDGGFNASDMYFKAIVPDEGGTAADGSFLTSFKGAVGPAQILPDTAKEVAARNGIKFSAARLNSDPDYNNQLGQLYFEEQLQTFGDPLKAAAAYNAGPGAVRAAMRKARKNGGNWRDYLPVTRKDGKVVDTTADYVARFEARVGGGGGGDTGRPITAPGQQGVTPPTYENVPELPKVDAFAPNAPEIPLEVETNRIKMAQDMLLSGNPDLVTLAQDYLDRGLTEQNQARILRAEQQFSRDNAGYTAALQDYYGQRGDARQYGYNSARDAAERNFKREDTYNTQNFTAGENSRDRDLRARIAEADRLESARQFGEELEFRRDTIKPPKNPFLETVGGIKMYEEITSENEQNTKMLTNIDRALDLLDKQGTGGYFALPGGDYLAGIAGGFDKEISQLRGIFNDATMQNIGGSLGVAISDGDRNFVEQIGPNMGSSTESNREKLKMLRSALGRKRDFNNNKIWALSDGGMALPEFNEFWSAYAESVPLFSMNEDNEIVYEEKPIDFRTWLQKMKSGNSYDANGNKVK